MLKSYYRRAFLLFALTALEPTAATAARGDDTPSVKTTAPPVTAPPATLAPPTVAPPVTTAPAANTPTGTTTAPAANTPTGTTTGPAANTTPVPAGTTPPIPNAIPVSTMLPVTAVAPTPSLWDVLSRTSTLTPEVAAVAQPLEIVRRPLGPVPGFTLPTTDTAAKKTKRGGFLGSIGDWVGRMETMTGSKVKATGNSTVTFRKDDISGSSTAYTSDQYLGQGSNGVYTNTDLSIDATLFRWLTYSTRITNSPFSNPADNRVKLDYNTKKVRVEYGDFSTGFSGNSLVDFNRYLHGIKLHNQWSSKFSTTLLYSQTKATPTTMVITGNNSTGPYYVYAGQIVDGSVQVRVDNQV